MRGFLSENIKQFQESNLFKFKLQKQPSELFCKVFLNILQIHSKIHVPEFLFKQSSRSTTLLKQRLWHMCFPANFANLRAPLLQSTSRQLLLKVISYRTSLAVDFNNCKLLVTTYWLVMSNKNCFAGLIEIVMDMST